MDYYDEIKNKLIENEVNRKIKKHSINKSDLNTYYNVGKMLSEAGKHYGEGIINKYSLKLINEVDKRYNTTNLKRMRQFYRMIEKGAPLGHQFSWSHYRELLPLKDINEIKYYIKICENLNLTRDELKERINNNEYKRLSIDSREKLVKNENLEIKDLVPNPIKIKNSNNYEAISEKILQKLILENIEEFMKELGNSFSFIGS